MQEFYYWFSTMADEGRVEGAERYNTHMSRMGEYQTLCGAIEGEVEGALESLASLEREYGVVASKTGALHEACEALVSQQGQLQRFADSVASKLAHFHEVERATARLSSPGFVPTDESFTALLQRLDAAVAFVREHPTFRESESHLAKLRQLLGRTLALARNHIVASLKQTATATAQATAGTPGKASAAVEDYSQLLHLKFSTLATRLRPLCHEIEARAAVAEYAGLLRDCEECYLNQRRTLVLPTVNEAIRLITIAQNATSLPTIVRSGCTYLSQVCGQEAQLYYRFFRSACPALHAYLQELCSPLYESLRASVIQLRSLESLCNLREALAAEAAGDSVLSGIVSSSRVEGPSAVHDLTARLAQDAAERLYFLAMTYFRDEISAYVPSAADLDYPAKLLPKKNAGEGEAAGEGAGQAAESDGEDASLSSPELLTATWYPTLERTLSSLAKLYLSVDPPVFEDLAHEAVSVCIASLGSAARAITRSKGGEHGQLFLLRHLLILREQIQPFDANFAITENSLDFSRLSEAVSRILSGQFAIGRNAWFEVVQQASPQVLHNELSSKKDLDKQIVSIAESYTSSTVRSVMEPVLSFLAQVTAASRSAASAGDAAPPPALSTLPFAQPAKVKALMATATATINEKLPPVASTLRLYHKGINFPSNRYNIILTLKENIVGYVEQFYSVLKRAGYDEAFLAELETAQAELTQSVDAIF